MKMITAFIKPHKLNAVTLALHDIKGLGGASISDVRGFGRGRAKGATGAVQYESLDYMLSVRVDVACSADLVEKVVEAIEQNAKTGLRGDGKIYVLEIGQAIRISTGERGAAAV